MTPEELKELSEHLKKKDSTWENIQKIALTGIGALVIWIFSTTNQTDKGLEVIRVESQQTKEKLSEISETLKDQLKEPRFTKKDFEAGVSPIISTLKGVIEKQDENENIFDRLSAESQSQEMRIKMLEIERKK